MEESEVKYIDTKGRTSLVVQSGREFSDVSWEKCRIILTNKRLVIVTSDGQTNIRHSSLKSIYGRYDVDSTIARVSGYIPLVQEGESGKTVRLITHPTNISDIRWKLQEVLLNNIYIQIKHPAVQGGVVKDNEWNKGKLDFSKDSLTLILENGTVVEVDYSEISSINRDIKSINSSKQSVLKIEHYEDDAVAESHLYGHSHINRHLYPFLSMKAKEQEGDIKLSEFEKQIITGLYSGVSPFEIHEFLGSDVDIIEDKYKKLIDKDVLEEVRKRKEVTLTARGRNIASEVINDA